MSKYNLYTIEQRIEDLRSVVKTQSAVGNYDANDYMHGLANGLILALSIIDEPYGAEVKFLSKPSEHIKYKDLLAIKRIGEP